ncbi:MAG TPA: glycosyltransferase family 2 protein [Anaerolineae bacterium]|nr:glycosyltransferase family 2 protein [Anaerolineae bacterium]
MSPLVYILTLNWNNLSATTDFLRSCATLTYPNFRVLVIDNASETGPLDVVLAQFPATELIVNDSNKGFAGGMNVGIQYALHRGADFIFLANNDTLLAPDMLDQLVGAAIECKADLASPAIYCLGLPDRIWSIGGRRSLVTLEVAQCYRRLDVSELQEPFVVDYVTGCGMLLSRRCVEKVGLFDERFFMYYEDSDYCLRARTEGCKIIVAPCARMWHHIAATIGGSNSPAERYHMALASVQFFKKHVCGWRWFIVILYRTASACKTVLRLTLSGHRASVCAYLRGLQDGLRR